VPDATPEIVERAISESNRIAKELLEPARARLNTLRAEFASNKEERNRLLDALLKLGAAGSTTAAERMRAMEERARALEAAIAEEEGRLGVDEARSLSMTAIHQVHRDFDQLYPYFTPGERRELLHEIIDEVGVYPDRVEVALYDGTPADAALAQAARKVRGPGGSGKPGAAKPVAVDGDGPAGVVPVHAVHAEVHASPEPREPSGRSTGGPRGTVKFAARLEWLPVAARTRNWETQDASLFLHLERTLSICYTPRAPAIRRARPEVSVLARATEWQCMLRRPGTNTRADLARYLGVSRAWITQGMAVLDAPPQVLDAMRRREAQGHPVTNGLWKRVAGMGVEDALRELDGRPR